MQGKKITSRPKWRYDTITDPFTYELSNCTALTKTLSVLSKTSANAKNFIAEAAARYTRLNLKPNLEIAN